MSHGMILSMAQYTSWQAKQVHQCGIYSGTASSLAIVNWANADRSAELS